MKKIIFYLMASCLLIAFLPQQLNATTTNAVTTTLVVPKSTELAESEALLIRLNEINIMDKSDLTRSEKKDLREEVRSIKSHLTVSGGGVYLSAGAVILIVILLIILL